MPPRNSIANALATAALGLAAVLGGSGTSFAQTLNSAVSDDGRGLSSVITNGDPAEFLPSFPGSGREIEPDETDDARASHSSRAETAAEIWSLWALKPVTARMGSESIIGPDQRVRIAGTTRFPYRTMVLITFGAGRCSGWLIGRDTVATAGHCVHSGGESGSWYDRDSYRIYPGRNGVNSPYGSCSAKRLFSVAGWTQRGGDGFDYGAIKLDCDIGLTTGWLGMFHTRTSLVGQPIRIAGYPGDKPLTLWQSRGTVTAEQPRRVFYRNDTVGGMSGSPVFTNRPRCGVCAMAVHAYGIYGRPPFADNNHGTRINRAVYRNFLRWRKSR